MSSDGRISLQPAYLLHRTPYRDTSLLIEAFTESHGRLGLVARGARSRRGGQAALLQPFQSLLLSWSGRGELHTLTAVEPQHPSLTLHGDSLNSSFYLNELLMRLLPRHDPHPLLYQRYAYTLRQLADSGMDEWRLRLFERDLLQELGYGLLLTHEGGSGEMVQSDACYCYHPEYGPSRQHNNDEPCLSVHGETLLCLAQGEKGGSRCRSEAKRLMRGVLAGYLGNRPLASRELFRQRYSPEAGREPSNQDEE
jgi:DNA repair protein RecO (recombination protein O)